ncbi:MAG: ABC transporter permease [Actinomycetota bacterium]
MATASVAINKASFLASTSVIAKRTFLKFIRTPQLVVVGTVQGAMFLLIFRYVFGGAIGAGIGSDYTNFLIPGFITTGIIFGGMAGAAGVAEDRELGFFDRLRSLPIPRSTVLAGRAIADTASAAWGLLVMTVIGFAVGFRLGGSIGAGLLAFALLVFYSFVLEWVFIALGMYAGNAQAAQGMSLLLIPLVFISSAFVPVTTLPSWMRGVAEHQPITYMIESVRTLSRGAEAEAILHHSTSYFVIRSLLWSVAIVALFGWISVSRYRKGV